MVSPFWGGFFEAARPGGGGGFAKSNQPSPAQQIELKRRLGELDIHTREKTTRAVEGAKLDFLKKKEEYLLPRQITEETRVNKAKLALEEKLRIKALEQKKDLAKIDLQTAKDVNIADLELDKDKHEQGLIYEDKKLAKQLQFQKDKVGIEAEARGKIAAITLKEASFVKLFDTFSRNIWDAKKNNVNQKGALLPVSLELLMAVEDSKKHKLMVDISGVPTFKHYKEGERIPENVLKDTRRFYRGYYITDPRYGFASIQAELLYSVSNAKTQGERVHNEIEVLKERYKVQRSEVMADRALEKPIASDVFKNLGIDGEGNIVYGDGDLRQIHNSYLQALSHKNGVDSFYIDRESNRLRKNLQTSPKQFKKIVEKKKVIAPLKETAQKPLKRTGKSGFRGVLSARHQFTAFKKASAAGYVVPKEYRRTIRQAFDEAFIGLSNVSKGALNYANEDKVNRKYFDATFNFDREKAILFQPFPEKPGIQHTFFIDDSHGVEEDWIEPWLDGTKQIPKLIEKNIRLGHKLLYAEAGEFADLAEPRPGLIAAAEVFRNRWLKYLDDNPDIHEKLLEEEVSSLSGQDQLRLMVKNNLNVDIAKGGKEWQVAALDTGSSEIFNGLFPDQKNMVEQANEAEGTAREEVLLARNKSSKLSGEKTLIKIIGILTDPRKAFEGSRWPDDDHLIFNAAFIEGYKAESIMKEFLEGDTDLKDIPIDIKKHVGRNIREKHNAAVKTLDDSDHAFKNKEEKRKLAAEYDAVPFTLKGKPYVQYLHKKIPLPNIPDWKKFLDAWQNLAEQGDLRGTLRPKQRGGGSGSVGLAQLSAFEAYFSTWPGTSFNPETKKLEGSSYAVGVAEKVIQEISNDPFRMKQILNAILLARRALPTTAFSVLNPMPENFPLLSQIEEVREALDQSFKAKSIIVDNDATMVMEPRWRHGQKFYLMRKITDPEEVEELKKTSPMWNINKKSIPNMLGKLIGVKVQIGPDFNAGAKVLGRGNYITNLPPDEDLPPPTHSSYPRLAEQNTRKIEAVNNKLSEIKKFAESIVNQLGEDSTGQVVPSLLELITDPDIQNIAPNVLNTLPEGIGWRALDFALNYFKEPTKVSMGPIEFDQPSFPSDMFKGSVKDWQNSPAWKEAEQTKNFGFGAINEISALEVLYPLAAATELQSGGLNPTIAIEGLMEDVLGTWRDKPPSEMVAIIEATAKGSGPGKGKAQALMQWLESKGGSRLSNIGGAYDNFFTWLRAGATVIRSAFSDASARQLANKIVPGSDRDDAVLRNVTLDRGWDLSDEEIQKGGGRFGNKKIYNRDNRKARLEDEKEIALDRLQKELEFADKETDDSKAASLRKIAMFNANKTLYAITLTYQFAGMVQGGSGGRAISNEDFEHLYAALWGGSGEIQAHNLKKAKQIVTHALKRAEIIQDVERFGPRVSNMVMKVVRTMQGQLMREDSRTSLDPIAALVTGGTKDGKIRARGLTSGFVADFYKKEREGVHLYDKGTLNSINSALDSALFNQTAENEFDYTKSLVGSELEFLPLHEELSGKTYQISNYAEYKDAMLDAFSKHSEGDPEEAFIVHNDLVDKRIVSLIHKWGDNFEYQGNNLSGGLKFSDDPDRNDDIRKSYKGMSMKKILMKAATLDRKKNRSSKENSILNTHVSIIKDFKSKLIPLLANRYLFKAHEEGTK